MSRAPAAPVDWSDSYETIATNSPLLAKVARASTALIAAEDSVERVVVSVWALDGERATLTFTVWTELETDAALRLSDELSESVEAIEREHGVRPGDSAIVVHWREAAFD